MVDGNSVRSARYGVQARKPVSQPASRDPAEHTVGHRSAAGGDAPLDHANPRSADRCRFAVVRARRFGGERRSCGVGIVAMPRRSRTKCPSATRLRDDGAEMAQSGLATQLNTGWTPPASIEQARALARERFKARLEAGGEVGNCGCDDGEDVTGPQDTSAAEGVVGVRFPDSGRVYYFRPGGTDVAVGDWVVVATARGQEAGRVVIAPHQLRSSLLDGELTNVVRPLHDDDVSRMDANKRKAADAV